MKKILLILSVPLVVFLSFFAMVWKEKSIRDYSLLESKYTREITVLESKITEKKISIEALSNSARLERYALDSLGLSLPKLDDIITIYRDDKGHLIVPDKGVKGFIKRLIGLE